MTQFHDMLDMLMDIDPVLAPKAVSQLPKNGVFAVDSLRDYRQRCHIFNPSDNPLTNWELAALDLATSLLVEWAT
jgi:hypothetical protein